MNEVFNEAGQSAWEVCSTQELIEMGLLDEATLEEMFADLGAGIEAETAPFAA